jgi:DNA-binding NarL/FixJ family response regulator
MASFLPEAGLRGKGMSKSSKQLQIYVVEDSPILMHLLAATIKTANAELVGHSDSAQRAISEISLLQPDLILIDIGLSFGSGFDVLRLLKERGIAHSASKVVLTNHANAEYKALSFRLGASQYYDKSSEILRVSELIRMMAAGHAASVRSPAPGASQDGSKQIGGVDRAFLAQLAPLKGATTTTPELNGPYTLTNTRVDSVVTQTSAGVYALGKTTGTSFGVSYVGRSDSDLNHALKARVGSYPQFKYGYLGSQRSASYN